MSNLKHHHLLAVLFQELESAGFLLGTHKYLQVQELMTQLPDDLPLEQLRGILSPLFANSPQEQQLFRILFLKSLAEVNDFSERSEGILESDVTQADKAKPEWRLLLPLIFIGLFLIGLFIKMLFFNSPEKIIRTERFSIYPGDSLAVSLLKFEEKEAFVTGAWPQTWTKSKWGGRYRVSPEGVGAYIAATNAPIDSTDTLKVSLVYAQDTLLIQWVCTIIEPSSLVDTGNLSFFDLPFPQNNLKLDSLRIDAQGLARFEWYQQWKWALKGMCLLALLLLAWRIVRWEQLREAKAVARLKALDRPPYVWNPKIDIEASVYLKTETQALLTRLRSRSFNERRALDLSATIYASTRAAGRIQLRYRQKSLPPDYLLLIDRLGAEDHRASLFDALYKVFRDAEASVARYFYDGDPRICFNEQYPQGISLSELSHQHPKIQLLIIGDGQGLLSTVEGQVAAWTTLLESWPNRVLLTTRPLQIWGRREKELQSLIPIFPASLTAFAAALDMFNSKHSRDINPGLFKNMPDVLQQPFAFEEELISDLQQHFSPAHLDWIAACALWPTLHWDLTLYLGTKIEEQTGANLLHFSGIRELTRLSWFVEGRIPEAARLILLQYLKDRELELPLRGALSTLFQEIPAPPLQTTAYAEHRMNLILNELFLKPDPALRRYLEKEFNRYLAAGKKADFVALQLLDHPPTPLDLLIEGRLKKHAFRESRWSSSLKFWLNVGGVWAILSSVVVVVNPVENICDGQIEKYNQAAYCISNDQERLLYLEQLIAEAIDQQNDRATDSLFKVVDVLNPQDTSIYLNSLTRYYNQGVSDYNCSRDANCRASSPNQLMDRACHNFKRGATLYYRLMKRDGLEFYSIQQRVCPLDSILQNNNIPASFQLKGVVIDLASTIPIANAELRLDTFSTRSNARGAYSFELPARSLQAAIRLEISATAPGYERSFLRTSLRNFLPPLNLRPYNDSQSSTVPRPAMVHVSAGSFEMGDQFNEGKADEKPVHTVRLNAFEIGRYEVTFAEYDLYCDSIQRTKPSDQGWGRGTRPVVNVSWVDAINYCNWLSIQHNYQPVYTINGNRVSANWRANGYRLPTEAEWEYAARGQGQKVRFGNGRDIADPKEMNFNARKEYKETYSVIGGFRGQTLPVGSFVSSNALGLQDMSGNVREWCWDGYQEDFYSNSQRNNPTGPDIGDHRVLRGGSFNFDPLFCRAAYRSWYYTTVRNYSIGFRLARRSP